MAGPRVGPPGRPLIALGAPVSVPSCVCGWSPRGSWPPPPAWQSAGRTLACCGWPSHWRGALPQCCHDWGRLGGTPGDWRGRPHGWNVMTDKDLLPEVLCHHSLRKSRGSGSCPSATSPSTHGRFIRHDPPVEDALDIDLRGRPPFSCSRSRQLAPRITKRHGTRLNRVTPTPSTTSGLRTAPVRAWRRTTLKPSGGTAWPPSRATLALS